MGSELEALTLTESRDRAFPRDALTLAEALSLRSLARHPIDVTPPSDFNEQCWILRSEGWVGQIPLGPERTLAIQPKVGIPRLFAMLEVAYNLDPVIFEGRYDAASLPELYSRLAAILAFRLLARARKGLYRTYVERRDDLPYVRGALDIAACTRRPALLRFPCEYQEHSADNSDNRIIAWALHRVLASGLCHEKTLPVVRRALHTLAGALDPVPVTASECVGRTYNRLNEDYATMHALSRFFLENTGPAHVEGDRAMVPFLVDMALLFERFVTEWLRAHLPLALRLHDQQVLVLGPHGELNLRMDLVLVDGETNGPVAVLDVKYKDTAQPSNADVFQVVAYATALGVRDAWLVYPKALPDAFDVTVGPIRVRTVAFDLAADFGVGGNAMLRAILAGHHSEASLEANGRGYLPVS